MLLVIRCVPKSPEGGRRYTHCHRAARAAKGFIYAKGLLICASRSVYIHD